MGKEIFGFGDENEKKEILWFDDGGKRKNLGLVMKTKGKH